MKQIYDKSIYDKSIEEIIEEMQEARNYLRQTILALIDAEIERVEGMKWDGEWIEIMKSASDAGFSTMKSPEDFIAGKNQALHDHLTYLKEQREIIDNS